MRVRARPVNRIQFRKKTARDSCFLWLLNICELVSNWNQVSLFFSSESLIRMLTFLLITRREIRKACSESKGSANPNSGAHILHQSMFSHSAPDPSHLSKDCSFVSHQHKTVRTSRIHQNILLVNAIPTPDYFLLSPCFSEFLFNSNLKIG